jgi:hypothetical protein
MTFGEYAVHNRPMSHFSFNFGACIIRSMHPFETVVMELTVHVRCKKDGLTLKTLLAEINKGWKELLQLSKDWITKVKS